MALGSDGFNDTDLAELIPIVWGQKLNDYFRAELIMGSFFTDRSDELANGGDTLRTPSLTEMSSNDKVTNSEVTLNSPTESKVDLTIDNWKEVSFIIEDREAAEYKRSYSLQQRYAQNAAHRVAKDLEDSIAGLFSDFSNTVGASGSDLADSDIRQAISTLQGNDVPGMTQNGSMDQPVSFFMHPSTYWEQVQGIDKFSLHQNSPSVDPTTGQPVYFLYGIPVRISTRVPAQAGDIDGGNGRSNLLAHKDAIHWASLPLGVESEGGMVGSEGVRVQANYVPEYLGTLTTADIAYGVVENRDEAGVEINCSN